MGAFATVLAMGIITFIICFHILGYSYVNDGYEKFDNFMTDVKYVYRLAYGDFNVDDYNTPEWILFVVATVFIPLIMFNMLIAIMSDTFERVSNSMESTDGRELNSLILE